MNKENFYSGASGLVLPMPKSLYPADFQNKSRLCYYASLFNSIEINSSFYKIPMASTIQKWVADVPDHFRFTFKLWKEITHNKGLSFNPTDVARFLKVIDIEKKGCLLVQFPPSLNASNSIQLQNLLAEIKANSDWRIAVELRHSSWYEEGIYDLLAQYLATFVIHDMPASAAPHISVSDDFVYVRFHGPEGRYRGSYPDDYLSEFAMYINEWRDEGKAVYVYFNNTMGDAFNNLVTLKQYTA